MWEEKKLWMTSFVRFSLYFYHYYMTQLPASPWVLEQVCSTSEMFSPLQPPRRTARRAWLTQPGSCQQVRRASSGWDTFSAARLQRRLQLQLPAVAVSLWQLLLGNVRIFGWHWRRLHSCWLSWSSWSGGKSLESLPHHHSSQKSDTAPLHLTLVQDYDDRCREILFYCERQQHPGLETRPQRYRQ
jgi:hypothetical protein